MSKPKRHKIGTQFLPPTDRIETMEENEDRQFRKLATRGIFVTRTPQGLHWEWKMMGESGDAANFIELMRALVDRLAVLEKALGIEEEEE